MGVFSQQQVLTYPRHKRSSKIYLIETVLLYGEFVTVSISVKLWSCTWGIFECACCWDEKVREPPFFADIVKNFEDELTIFRDNIYNFEFMRYNVTHP